MRLSLFRAIREKKTLAILCFGILSVMIVAAFWPFNPNPANHVTWLSNQNGLRFNGGGIVLTTKGSEIANSPSTAGVSLELWLEPSQESYSNALLAFSSPANPEQFRLRQSHDFLLILQEPRPRARHMGMTWLWVPHAFQAHKRGFIAISSGASGTTVYLDGVNDAEPPHPKSSAAMRIDSFIVGATVHDGLAHLMNVRYFGGVARLNANQSGYTTHNSCPCRVTSTNPLKNCAIRKLQADGLGPLFRS